MSVTWEDCHAAGMTAQEAAEATGKTRAAAYKWSRKKNLSWRQLSLDDRANRIRAGMGKPIKPRPIPCNSLGLKRDDREALPPEQQRHGGVYWLENLKTGQRVTKNSATGVYREAQLRGWTEWDWGKVE